jgi:hypothetical protein
MIHYHVYYLKYDISDTGVCVCLEVEPTQLGPVVF